MGERTNSFLAGAAGGLISSVALNAPRGTFRKIWNILCIIFLPMWAALFGAANGRAGATAAFGIIVLGGLCTLFAGIASVKVFSGGSKITKTVALWWGAFVAYGSIGKGFILSPIALLLVAAATSVFSAGAMSSLLSALTVISAVVVGAVVGRAEKARLIGEEEYVDGLLHQISMVFGSPLDDGSVSWGSEPGSIVISPIPVGASRTMGQLTDLHGRCSEFAPDFEVSELASNRVVFSPVREAIASINE